MTWENHSPSGILLLNTVNRVLRRENDLGNRWRREKVTPILATKLYIPRLRPNVVSRPRLLERLNEGLHRKLILIAAPAGFGKTTLVSEWVEGIERATAWL